MRQLWTRSAVAAMSLAAMSAMSFAQQNDQDPLIVGAIRIEGGPKGAGGMTIISDGVQQDLVMDGQGQWVSANGAGKQAPVKGANKSGAVNLQPGQPMMIGGPGMGIEQIQQKINDSLRESLGCSEQEWKILWPRIQKVQVLQSAIGERPSGSLFFRSSSDASVPELVADVRAKASAFDKLLRSDNASDAQVKQAMDAVREARRKARTELNRDRKDLTDLITPRQEAILYQRGILEQ